MPATINGYEVFALPCSRESSETVSYAEFRNVLGVDGYRSHVLYGADTGLRRFSIPYDQGLVGGSATPITVGGVAMSRATYLRDLFRRKKVDGVPFVIQSLENNQYYLVEFAESEQSFTKKLAAMYATQIELVQVRLPNVSVFDMTKTTGLWAWMEAWEGVIDHGPLGNDFTGNGNSAGVGTSQNGLTTIRFNSGATNTGYWNRATSVTIYEAMFVIKINESTFSNFGGLLTADTGVAAITGDSGQTRFYDQGFGDGYTYRKNGVLYPESNQQAPMNAFGLVHCRWEGGIGLTNPQIGKDRADASRHLEMDFAECSLSYVLPPLSESLEKAEDMMTRWNI